MTEWRPVIGFEGRYEVSDDGRVKSLAAPGRGRYNSDHIMALRKNRNGYPQVQLTSADGRHTTFRVHRLVLEAFVGPRPPGAFVLHADDNRENNHLANLRWGSRSENTMDSVRNGNHNQARKTHCKQGHALEGENVIRTGRKRHCRTCKNEKNRAYMRRYYERRRNEQKEAA